MSKKDFSERMKYPDFDEEPEGYPEMQEQYAEDELRECYSEIDDYYPSYRQGFEGLELSGDVDEMGFPKYDRLSGLQRSFVEPGPSSHAKEKPKVKKRTLKRDESKDYDYLGVQYTPEESGNEIKDGLSDDLCYSSEDSFAAGYSSNKPGYVSASYNEFPATTVQSKERSFFIDSDNFVYNFPEVDDHLDTSEKFDIANLPPPFFPGDQPDDVSDD